MSQSLTRRGEPSLEIVCDFDGTISRPDTIDQILGQLADPAWRVIEERWQRGEIESRECMTRQIALVHGGWPAIERFLDARVSLHPSFAPFAVWATELGIPLRIASEGIEQVILHLLGREGLRVDSVWATRLKSGEDGSLALDFSHATGRTRCGAPHCKCELFDRGGERPIRVLVGDGRSDFCAARWADVVFARSALLDHCRSQNIPAIPFDSFDVVRACVEGLAPLRVSHVERIELGRSAPPR